VDSSLILVQLLLEFTLSIFTRFDYANGEFLRNSILVAQVVIFGHQLGGTIGQFVKDLEFIAQASDPEDWQNMVEYIPF
jgi:hypothetical protein